MKSSRNDSRGRGDAPVFETKEPSREDGVRIKKQNLDWKLLGGSEHIAKLRKEILYVAQKIQEYDFTVLIEGPSGTGKELIAREIYNRTNGKDFIAINCAALPQTLFESELFGYKKGAFTDAVKDKPGLN